MKLSALVFAVGTLIGVFVGRYEVALYHKPPAPQSGDLELLYQKYVADYYWINGADTTARDHLMTWLETLNSVAEDSQQRFANEGEVKLEKAVVYYRLAILAANHDELGSAEQYFNDAIKTCEGASTEAPCDKKTLGKLNCVFPTSRTLTTNRCPN